MAENSDVFWFDNYKVLYENDNYILFFPRKNTSRVEQLNSIARFSIYLFVLLLLFGDPLNTTWLYIPIFMLLGTIILYKFKDSVAVSNNKDDSKDYLEIDPTLRTIERNKNIIEENYDGKCHPPTEDNPLMNPTIYDDDLAEYNPACSNEDPYIKEKVRDEFNKNLFRDVNDMYEKTNSQRTYYSAPSTTIPNDQKAFAEWCYAVPQTCKTDQQKCLRYDDLRYSRRVSPYEYVI